MNIEYNRKNNAEYGDIINYNGKTCILIFEKGAEYECVIVDLEFSEVEDGATDIEEFNRDYEFVLMGRAKDITLKIGD